MQNCIWFSSWKSHLKLMQSECVKPVGVVDAGLTGQSWVTLSQMGKSQSCCPTIGIDIKMASKKGQRFSQQPKASTAFMSCDCCLKSKTFNNGWSCPDAHNHRGSSINHVNKNRPFFEPPPHVNRMWTRLDPLPRCSRDFFFIFFILFILFFAKNHWYCF